MGSPRAPDHLGGRGRRFWHAAWERWRFDEAEREVLIEACRVLSLMEGLEEQRDQVLERLEERGVEATSPWHRRGDPPLDEYLVAVRSAFASAIARARRRTS